MELSGSLEQPPGLDPGLNHELVQPHQTNNNVLLDFQLPFKIWRSHGAEQQFHVVDQPTVLFGEKKTRFQRRLIILCYV